jgi:murein L,D-transpeptidase YcbB/YkuD
VPDSIGANEYLPFLRQDPTILQRMGLRVSYNADATIHLSQPPGEQNALGHSGSHMKLVCTVPDFSK